MCLSKPSMPEAPAMPPPPPRPARPVNAAIRRAGDSNRQIAALAVGRNDTVLTSSQGLTSPANTTKKQLLSGTA